MFIAFYDQYDSLYTKLNIVEKARDLFLNVIVVDIDQYEYIFNLEKGMSLDQIFDQKFVGYHDQSGQHYPADYIPQLDLYLYGIVEQTYLVMMPENTSSISFTGSSLSIIESIYEYFELQNQYVYFYYDVYSSRIYISDILDSNDYFKMTKMSNGYIYYIEYIPKDDPILGYETGYLMVESDYIYISQGFVVTKDIIVYDQLPQINTITLIINGETHVIHGEF